MKIEKIKNLDLFIQIIDASPSDLITLNDLSLNDDCCNFNLYRNIMINYYESNIEFLKNTYKQIRKLKNYPSEELEIIEILCKLRFEIRASKLSLAYVNYIYLNFTINNHWSGELYFVLAIAYENLNQFQMAKVLYQKSYDELKNIGSTVKSLKALHNVIATNSRIDNSKRLIDDQFFLYKESRKMKIKNVAGISLMNIAREYQIIGLLKIAERYAVRARALLRHEPNTMNYYMSLLYHTHILLDIGKNVEAEKLIDKCLYSNLPDVKACLKILLSLKNNIPPHMIYFKKDEFVPPGWISRLYEREDKINATDLEEKLILSLSKEPKSREDVARFLFGDELDKENILDRLKNLISRVKKKWPELIIIPHENFLFLSGQGEISINSENANKKVRSNA